MPGALVAIHNAVVVLHLNGPTLSTARVIAGSGGGNSKVRNLLIWQNVRCKPYTTRPLRGTARHRLKSADGLGANPKSAVARCRVLLPGARKDDAILRMVKEQRGD